jgi:hypothetical protein
MTEVRPSVGEQTTIDTDQTGSSSTQLSVDQRASKPPEPPVTTCCRHARRRVVVSTELSMATQILMGAQVAGFSLAALLANSYRNSLTEVARLENFAQSAVAEARFYSFLPYLVLGGIASFVLMVIWSAQVHEVTTGMIPSTSRRKYSVGMTIGSWFIPFANAILTPRILAEHQKLADAPRFTGWVHPEWQTTKMKPSLVVWWVLMTTGGVIVWGSSGTGSGLQSDSDAALGAQVFGYLLLAVGFTFGINFVGHVSKKLQY